MLDERSRADDTVLGVHPGVTVLAMDVPRTRREPPSFRPVTVRSVEPLTPRMIRITLSGSSLAGFPTPDPAASVRLLLPRDGRLTIPVWNSNEFLFPDGSRPTIRTFTPRRFNPDGPSLDLDVVLHGSGAVSRWAAAAEPGAEAAISGPGSGYAVNPEAPAFALLGDETAIPAICRLLEVLPEVPIAVHIEIATLEARLDLHRDVETHWHVLPDGGHPCDTLVEAGRTIQTVPGLQIWAAGEAAGMQRLRRYFITDQHVPRSDTSIRGYWKQRRPS